MWRSILFKLHGFKYFYQTIISNNRRKNLYGLFLSNTKFFFFESKHAASSTLLSNFFKFSFNLSIILQMDYIQEEEARKEETQYSSLEEVMTELKNNLQKIVLIFGIFIYYFLVSNLFNAIF